MAKLTTNFFSGFFRPILLERVYKNLLEKLNIIKVYLKNNKKSISSVEPVDLFIALCVLVLMISPIISNFILRLNTGIKRTEMFLSVRCEELFGKDTTQTLLREFEERNPDLQIKTAGEKSREPDILIFDENDYNDLVARGALASLETYIHTENRTVQFAVPLVSFMDLLFYNIELLKNAGFARPPKTRDEFFACAKAVSDGGGASGAAMSLNFNDKQALSRDVFSWIWASGGDFWSGTKGPIINSKSVIGDISFLGRLYREGVLAPRTFDMTGERRLEEFAQGKIAMITASTHDIPLLRKKMGDGAFGITAIPGSVGKYNIGLSGCYAGISSNCAYPDEAWTFLVFLIEQSSSLCEELKAVPGVVSGLFPGAYIKDDPFYLKAWNIFESSEIVQGFSGKAGWKAYSLILQEEMQAFFENMQTAEETAALIQRRWDTVFLANNVE